MNHETLKALILTMDDPETNQLDRSAAQTHLDTCAECRQISKEWTQISPRLFGPRLSLSSEAFVSNVMNKIYEQEKPLPWTMRWLAPAFAVGLAAVAAWWVPQQASLPTTEELMFSQDADATFAAWSSTSDTLVSSRDFIFDSEAL